MSSTSTTTPVIVVHDNSFLTPSVEPQPCTPFCLILLNGNKGPPSVFKHLWSTSEVKICADGGANYLYDSFNNDTERKKYCPDYIKGDMDSIRPSVCDFYETNGTKIIRDADQDSNDLEKCLALPLQNCKKYVILGALGGRFDQEMQNINALYKHVTLDILLMSSETTVRLLPAQLQHEIRPNFEVEEHCHCGLVPLGAPCESITATGLKWSLQNAKLDFGGIVSSSNVVTGSACNVLSSDPVIWTTSVKSSV